MIGVESCDIPFLDCRGYYDLAAEIIVTIVATMTLIRALHNHHEFKLELRIPNESEYGSNMIRKVRISLINSIFLSVMLGHIVFSMVLFTVANQQQRGEDGKSKSGVQIILETKLNLWYQFTHLLVVQLLNCLVVVVGRLYWHTLNSFYAIKELQTPILYRSFLKYPINALLIFQGGVVVAGLVDSLFDFDGLQTVLNWLVFASEILSTAFFIVYRILYHKNIFSSVKLGKKTVQREHVHNIIIILTSLGRVVLCLLISLDISPEGLRKYDQNSNCHDMLPYHALSLLFIRIAIDILPAFIFTRIFGPQSRNRSTSNLEQTLFSKGQSQSSGI